MERHRRFTAIGGASAVVAAMFVASAPTALAKTSHFTFSGSKTKTYVEQPGSRRLTVKLSYRDRWKRTHSLFGKTSDLQIDDNDSGPTYSGVTARYSNGDPPQSICIKDTFIATGKETSVSVTDGVSVTPEGPGFSFAWTVSQTSTKDTATSKTCSTNANNAKVDRDGVPYFFGEDITKLRRLVEVEVVTRNGQHRVLGLPVKSKSL